MLNTKAPITKSDDFYKDALKILNKSKIPFMVGGTFAVNVYTGLNRATKDMDIFCRAGDFPKIVELFTQHGYKANVEDERWLAKVFKGKAFFDIIFNSGNAMTPITDAWLEQARTEKIYDLDAKILAPTELIFAKVFVQDRYKYDGADVAHMILVKNKEVDWKRLLGYLDQYWEVLLIHLLNFRFIYPSEREIIPHWLVEELVNRLQSQINLPTSKMKICRGRLFSVEDYAIDVKEWGFADIIGPQNEPKQEQKK